MEDVGLDFPLVPTVKVGGFFPSEVLEPEQRDFLKVLIRCRISVLCIPADLGFAF